MRNKLIWFASAAAVLAIPAIAQQTAAPPSTPATSQPAQSVPVAAQPSTATPASTGADESAVEEVSALNLPPPAPPVEYPGWHGAILGQLAA